MNATGHPHGGHAHDADPRAAARPLVTALAITLGLLALEAVGGWLAGSLALLADAGHLLADVGALGIGLIGSWVASRPATAQMSYGYRRAEILAAIANGLALWGVAAAILYEAVRRFGTPHPVWGPGMLVVATLGLAGNLVNIAVLAPSSGATLNLRMASAHVVADAASAVGTVAASIVILVTGWTTVDAIVGCAIAVLILAASRPLLREAVQILMEAAPAHLSLPQVEEAMRGMPGVADVHDLHIWSVASGLEAVSGHVILAGGADGQRVLRALCHLLRSRFGLGHVTLQVETEDPTDPWHPRCAPGPQVAPRR